MSVGSKPLWVSQQPSQDDCAGEKCDIKSYEALPLESSGLKAPGLFQLFPSLSRTMNQSEQTQPLSQLGNWGTKRSDSLHSYLPVRNSSMGQEPCKKTQFSISKVSSFLQALKPGATPVAGKVLLSPQPHPEPLPAQQLCNHPEQGKRRVAWFGGCSQPVELAKPCSLLAPGIQDKPCSQQGLHRDGLATEQGPDFFLLSLHLCRGFKVI